jgi:CheY-like chemotaxis protein
VAAERFVVLAGGDQQLADFLQRHLGGWRVTAAADLAAAVDAAVEVRAQAILADLDAEPADAAGLPAPLVRLPLPHGERLSSALGAVGHLVKPVTREALQAAIARLGRPIDRVLLVDDDPDFVRQLARLLQTGLLPDGSVIRRAHTGREALAAMAEEPPDLILLDLVMPELGGDEVLRRMRASAKLTETPVILLSGEDQLQAQFPLHGPLSVVAPEGFRLEELLGAIEALLGALRPPRAYLTAPPAST